MIILKKNFEINLHYLVSICEIVYNILTYQPSSIKMKMFLVELNDLISVWRINNYANSTLSD